MSDLVERAKQCADDTDDWKADVILHECVARIEKLEAALRAVMDDLTLIDKNHWLPVGLLDDVIYVNARDALEGKP